MNHNDLEALLRESRWTIVRQWDCDWAIYPLRDGVPWKDMKSLLELGGAPCTATMRLHEGEYQTGLCVTLNQSTP